MSKLSEDVIKCNEKIPMHRNSRSGLPFALAKMLLIILKVCPNSLVFHTKALLICIFVIVLSNIVKLIFSGSLNKIINAKRLVLIFLRRAQINRALSQFRFSYSFSCFSEFSASCVNKLISNIPCAVACRVSVGLPNFMPRL